MQASFNHPEKEHPDASQAPGEIIPTLETIEEIIGPGSGLDDDVYFAHDEGH